MQFNKTTRPLPDSVNVLHTDPVSWDAYKKCSVRMASDEDRLIEIVREFVQNEMALQRSGSGSGSGSGSNASLLSRTRNLISNVSRSASREAAASPVQASFEAEVPTRKVKTRVPV